MDYCSVQKATFKTYVDCDEVPLELKLDARKVCRAMGCSTSYIVYFRRTDGSYDYDINE